MIGKFAGDRHTLIARTVILTISFIALVFLITAIALQQGFSGTGDGWGLTADGMALGPVGWSIIWTTTSLCINFCGKTYHPGVDIALEFVAFALGVGMVWILIDWLSTIGSYNTCSEYYRGDRDMCSATRARVLRASEVIAATMILISILIHIYLFVKACRATRKLDVERKRAKAEKKSSVQLEEQNKHLQA